MSRRLKYQNSAFALNVNIVSEAESITYHTPQVHDRLVDATTGGDADGHVVVRQVNDFLTRPSGINMGEICYVLDVTTTGSATHSRSQCSSGRDGSDARIVTAVNPAAVAITSSSPQLDGAALRPNDSVAPPLTSPAQAHQDDAAAVKAPSMYPSNRAYADADKKGRSFTTDESQVLLRKPQQNMVRLGVSLKAMVSSINS